MNRKAQQAMDYRVVFLAALLLLFAGTVYLHSITSAWTTQRTVSEIALISNILSTPTRQPGRASDDLDPEGGSPYLLNRNFIRNVLNAEAPWAESHGGDHNMFLGGGMLYYSWAYAMQAKTIVVLGSGGGFVARILRQAQRDMEAAGMLSDGNSRLYLIDAHLPSAGWGSTFYAHNKDALMHREFPDIEYLFQKTDDAILVLGKMLKLLNITVDYLHIDADHSFQQSWRDFENYSPLLSNRSVVSFHDTCHDPPCATGVHQTVKKLREREEWQVLDAHYFYRGIAFAIPKAAEELRNSRKWRRNFCRNNHELLDKTNNGFQRGRLGDFAGCFLEPELQQPFSCPFGKMTAHPDSRNCTICMPGMIGDDCSTFRHQTLREQYEKDRVDKESLSTKSSSYILHHAASFLIKRKSHRVLQWGLDMPGKESLLDSPALRLSQFVLVDPLVTEPMWVDKMETGQNLRMLPCKLEDIIKDRSKHKEDTTAKPLNGLYQKLLQLKYLDTFVCLECNERVPSGLALLALLEKVLPQVKTLVLEGPASSEKTFLDESIESLTTTKLTGTGLGALIKWEVDSDIELKSTSLSKASPSLSRRLIFLSRHFKDPSTEAATF